jgi:glycosyltransferase involved in cell wall biosynthesis
MNDSDRDAHRIARILVVVPVRNEERLLPCCLTAFARAAARIEVPVRVQLVLDACTDGSARVPASNVEVITVDERNVGAARALGFGHAGATCGAEPWFATTDADSEVDETWLGAQLAYARTDVDVVAVRQWSEHASVTRRTYEKHYREQVFRAHRGTGTYTAPTSGSGPTRTGSPVAFGICEPGRMSSWCHG